METDFTGLKRCAAALLIAIAALLACGPGASSPSSARRAPPASATTPPRGDSVLSTRTIGPGGSAQAVVEGSTVASASVGGWQSVTVFPPLVSPVLGSLFEQWRSELDPAHWFATHPELPPPGFHPWPSPIKGPFPGARTVKQVVAHRFAQDRQKPGQSLLDTWVRGCGGDLIDERGARCPSVSYPGRELSSSEMAELVSIVNTPNDVPRTIMNAFNVRFGFLFFDEQQRPVAQVLVNASVDKLVLSPRNGEAMDTMMPSRRERLRALLVSLGLLQPDVPDQRELLNEQQRVDGELFRLRFLPSNAGVPTEARLSELTEPQKVLLCYWHATSGFLTSDRGYECDSGLRLVGQDVRQCVATFPTCDLTVGEAEDCMRRHRVDRCYERTDSRRCGELRHCLWGVVELPPKGDCDVAQHRWYLAVTPRSQAARARLLKGFPQDPMDPPHCIGKTLYYQYSGWQLPDCTES